MLAATSDFPKLQIRSSTSNGLLRSNRFPPNFEKIHGSALCNAASSHAHQNVKRHVMGVVWKRQHPRGSSSAKMAESMEASSAASGLKDGVGLAMSERPTCILCLGMAGSGKTTFVQVASEVKFIQKVLTDFSVPIEILLYSLFGFILWKLT